MGIPTQKGQNLSITPIDEPKIFWESIGVDGHIWFKGEYDIRTKKFIEKNAIARSLSIILQKAVILNPAFLNGDMGFRVRTQLEFPRDWGLGSSSTLINNIANWANVNAFQLLEMSFKGSGYDIACAQHNSPILFERTDLKPIVTSIEFSPVFKEQLYFVHLDKKQRSSREITRYQNLKKGIPEAVKTVSEITRLLTQTTDINDFNMLLLAHENLVSSILQTPRIQTTLFKDYFGQTKSLGAWGGDFILATGNKDTPNYFIEKGFNTVLLYDEMVLHSK